MTSSAGRKRRSRQHSDGDLGSCGGAPAYSALGVFILRDWEVSTAAIWRWCGFGGAYMCSLGAGHLVYAMIRSARVRGMLAIQSDYARTDGGSWGNSNVRALL